jgi:hypothetical protein
MSDRKALNAALRAANDTLRAKALEQAARIESLERYIAALGSTIGEAIWRNLALSWQLWGPPNPTKTPPREIPHELMSGYTMNGQAEIVYSYIDSTYPDNWPVIYTDYQIDRFLERIDRRQYFIYGMTDVWMWEAIAKYPVRGLDVVNMGSLTPWYESNCIYFGARPTTIDYNRILARTKRINTMTVQEWDREQKTFDVAWSISSFEHDGLGMYGDPLDPDGDLKAMRKMKRIVKPGGLLFLALPVGKDKVLFNNARIYGSIRLKLLLEGWEQLETFGLQPVHLEGPGHIQPIFILRNV